MAVAVKTIYGQGQREVVMAIVIALSALSIIVVAPFIAQRVMGLKGGIGKGAMVGFVSLGANIMIGMVAGHLGPLGGIVGIMGYLAAWFQIVKVVHGTDTAQTIVFMFWHLFFQLLLLSLLQLFVGQGYAAWAWPF